LIVRPYPYAGELGTVRAHPGEIDVDDGDRVPFEIDVSPFPRGDGDQFAVRARLDAEGAGLHGNARRDFDDRNALSASCRSMTDTSLVPAFPENR